jgi:TolA-binding protein
MDVTNLEALGEHVASRLEASVEAHGDDALRAKLAERAASGKPRSAWTKPRRLIPVFGLAAVAVTAAFLLVPGKTQEPLTFTVGTPPRPGVLGESVAAPAESGTSLRFSEGSRIALDPLGRAKVARSNAAGAELVLESGRARVDIVPRVESLWRVQTGPFVVLVTGTRFDVEWDPASDRFQLALYEGKVTVSGCSFGAGKKLIAGERAEASCNAKTDTVRPISAAPRGEPAKAEQPKGAAALEPSGALGGAEPPNREARTPGERPARAPNDWTALARSGRYRDAYAAASSAGIAEECGRRNADDVFLLGETARLSDHPEDARRAYQAVRRRFPGSAAAAQAAFGLGRLEVRAGNKGASAAWFEAYLAEQPSGPLAQAALGRLLEARVELGDTRAARDTARAYLQRYPAGPHAEAARDVLTNETAR